MNEINFSNDHPIRGRGKRNPITEQRNSQNVRFRTGSFARIINCTTVILWSINRETRRTSQFAVIGGCVGGVVGWTRVYGRVCLFSNDSEGLGGGCLKKAILLI